jgi:ribonuclease BN (tRNA processing enzyme)
MHPVRIHFLGTGDAFSAGGRNQAAYLIQSSGSALLLDCGASILAALKRHGLSAEPIDTVLISHFHGDHFAGLPFLFLEYVYVSPRRRPLKIVGPPGVEERVLRIFQAMYADSAAEPLPYAVEFIETEPQRWLSLGGARVCAFRAPHQESPVSLGYEILLDGRKIVYTGDSGWSEELVEHARDADLFLCECSFFETRLDTHLDYPRIAENLPRLGAKKVVLTHLGQEVLQRQQEVAVEMAHDGLVVTI